MLNLKKLNPCHLFLIASLYFTFFLRGAEAIENEENSQLTKAPITKYFSKFKEMSPHDYISHCLPELNVQDQEKATEVYQFLMTESPLPINEGNPQGVQSIPGTLLKEGGYSFPPISYIQGPFLAACGQSPFKKIVLDVGPGGGSDTIMALLTQNIQVIAIDIYPEQLKILEERVNTICKGTKIGHFIKSKYDFSISEPLVEYQEVFDIINANKVFHFLNDNQTKKMLENFHFMLKKDGLVFITVMSFTAKCKEYEQFIQNKKANTIAPGIIYYNTERKAITQERNKKIVDFMAPQKRILSKNEVGLPTPGHKIETLVQRRFDHYHVISQARHFHDLDTLRNYLSPAFEILDDAIYSPDDDDHFLSVIARKK